MLGKPKKGEEEEEAPEKVEESAGEEPVAEATQEKAESTEA